MKIARLCIENVRAIERLEIELTAADGEPRRRIILLGGNGVGKSTLLAGIAHVFGRERAELGARRLGAGDIRQAGRSQAGVTAERPRGTITMEVSLSQAEREGLVRGTPQKSTQGLPRLATLRADLTQRGDPWSSLLDGTATTFDVAAELRQLKKWLSRNHAEGELARQSHEWARQHEAGTDVARNVLWIKIHPPVVLLPADRGALNGTSQVRVSDLSEFAPFKGSLSDTRERFQLIPSLLALAHANPALNDRDGMVARMWKVLATHFSEMPRLVGVRGLELLFETPGGAVVSLAELSDGQRAVLLILGELALRNPADGIVLIDEIEQHLHPRWQQAMLDALIAILPDAQFIITTQAPYVAASAPDDVLVIGDWGHDGPQ